MLPPPSSRETNTFLQRATRVLKSLWIIITFLDFNKWLRVKPQPPPPFRKIRVLLSLPPWRAGLQPSRLKVGEVEPTQTACPNSWVPLGVWGVGGWGGAEKAWTGWGEGFEERWRLVKNSATRKPPGNPGALHFGLNRETLAGLGRGHPAWGRELKK